MGHSPAIVTTATRLALVLWATLALAPCPAWAIEEEVLERPMPDTAQELLGPLAQSFADRVRAGVMFPRFKAALHDLPPFFRDTSLTLHLRTYYFDKKTTADVVSEAWAAGGWLAIESGWLADAFQVGTTLYTSQPLYAPDDRDGTQLLKPGQAAINVVGQAYARLRYEDHKLTLGWQELNIPYLNVNDSRMVPNTFEGAVLRGELPGGRYGLGYVSRMKLKDSDEFRAMSDVAGVAGSHTGMAVAGARFAPAEGVSLGAAEYWVADTLNIVYGEAEYARSLTPAVGLRLSAQLTDQRSTGAGRLAGSPFDTQSGGVRLALSYAGAVLTLAGSSTASGAAIVSPFGGRPGYLSLMQKDFDRAGEDGWLVGLAYDFARLGAPGVSAFFNFARGTGARDAKTGQRLPDEREYDLTIDYKPAAGVLSGLWLRLRGSWLQEGAPASKLGTQLRCIVNYEFRGL